MYLHLGQDSVIRESTLIGIFDLDNTTSSKITREFLNKAQREGRTVSVSNDLPRAFALTEEGGKTTVYLTLLSSQTLFKRAADEEFI